MLSEEYGFWFYAIVSSLFFVAPLPFFWASYICITGGEYWPLILFGGIISFSWYTAFSLFCKARKKFQGDRNK